MNFTVSNAFIIVGIIIMIYLLFTGKLYYGFITIIALGSIAAGVYFKREDIKIDKDKSKWETIN